MCNYNTFINNKQVINMVNLVPCVYERLTKRYGPLGWWPADTAFEVMIGAILTQNTNWGNVEKAIANLKQHPKNKPLDPLIMHNLPVDELATLIRPSGFFNIKAKRIINFLDWYHQHEYSVDKLLTYYNISSLTELVDLIELAKLRRDLLTIKGVGHETADSILLYALEQPVFVIDAYTRRIFSRLGVEIPKDYDSFQQLFMENLPLDAMLFNQYHALIVQHAKQHCKTKPSCLNCPLQEVCVAFNS